METIKQKINKLTWANLINKLKSVLMDVEAAVVDGGGQVNEVESGTGVTVDSTDPVKPVVNLSSSTITSLGLADTATQPGDLGAVATSNDYDDLDNKPSLADVATSGLYSDISGTPTLATVATSGDYDDLTNKPTLATVAGTGNYSDLLGTPSLGAVATSNDYNDLDNKPDLTSVTAGSGITVTGTGTIADPYVISVT